MIESMDFKSIMDAARLRRLSARLVAMGRRDSSGYSPSNFGRCGRRSITARRVSR